MVKYIIYAIFDENKNVYIGNTKQGLHKRIGKHLTDLRMYLGLTDKGSRAYRASFDVLVSDRYKCQILDEIETNDVRHVTELESLYILKYLNDDNVCCTNKCVPNINTKKRKIIDYSNLNDIDFFKDCEYNINKKKCSKYHYTNFIETNDN
jgi:hypothetical protein